MSKPLTIRGIVPLKSGDIVPVSSDSDVVFISGELHKDSTRQSTQELYRSKLAKAALLGLQVPCSEGELIRFIEHIAARFKYTTINGYVCAVKWYHQMNDLPSPDRTGKLALTMRNLHKKKKEAGERHHQAAPFLYEDLKAVVDFCDLEPLPMHDRNRAILMLMYFGAMRRSELVSMNIGDLTFGHYGCLITLGRTKNDRNKIFIPRNETDDRMCAVARLEEYLDGYKRGAKPSDAVFNSCHSSGRVFKGRLTTNAVSDLVKYCMEKIGHKDPQAYSGHSPRHGFVTDAVHVNANPIEISDNARMSLSMVKTYAKVGTAAAAKKIIRNK